MARASRHLRRVRRPGPPEPQGYPPAHQGPARARGRRPGPGHRRRPRPLHDPGRRRRRPARRHRDEGPRARPQGRRRRRPGRLVGDTTGADGSLARIVRVAPRGTVLRRTADDTDPVERVIVANADQLVIVTALADPEPRPRLIDRCLVAAYDAGHGAAARADQGRPRRPGAVPRRSTPPLDGAARRHRAAATAAPTASTRCASALRGPGQRARRPLRRRQVDAGQRAGAATPARDRRRQRRDRPGPAHLVVGGRAARCPTTTAGSSTPRACGRSAWPTSTRPGSSSTSPTSSRARPSARAAAPTTRRSAPSTPGSPAGPPGPAGPSRLDSLRRLLRARTAHAPTTADIPLQRTRVAGRVSASVGRGSRCSSCGGRRAARR